MSKWNGMGVATEVELTNRTSLGGNDTEEKKNKESCREETDTTSRRMTLLITVQKRTIQRDEMRP